LFVAGTFVFQFSFGPGLDQHQISVLSQMPDRCTSPYTITRNKIVHL